MLLVLDLLLSRCSGDMRIPFAFLRWSTHRMLVRQLIYLGLSVTNNKFDPASLTYAADPVSESADPADADGRARHSQCCHAAPGQRMERCAIRRG